MVPKVVGSNPIFHPKFETKQGDVEYFDIFLFFSTATRKLVCGDGWLNSLSNNKKARNFRVSFLYPSATRPAAEAESSASMVGEIED